MPWRPGCVNRKQLERPCLRAPFLKTPPGIILPHMKCKFIDKEIFSKDKVSSGSLIWMVANSISQDAGRRKWKRLVWEHRCLAQWYPSTAQTKYKRFTNGFNRPEIHRQHTLGAWLRDFNPCLFAYGFIPFYSSVCFLSNLHGENDQVALGNYVLGLILNVGNSNRAEEREGNTHPPFHLL